MALNSIPIFMMADSGARGSMSADSPAGRDAWSDGQTFWRDHRDAGDHELPRGPYRVGVLYFDSRSAKGVGRYGTQDGELGIPRRDDWWMWPRMSSSVSTIAIRSTESTSVPGRGRRDHRAPARSCRGSGGLGGYPRSFHGRGYRGGQSGDR